MASIAAMKKLHLASVDLNLLVALDALLTARSVTRAAAQLGLTQSATSHALGRLRQLFGDELLIRSPRGMLPTPRAEELAIPIRAVLLDIERAVAHAPGFDPATATTTFTIAAQDYAELLLLPALIERLRVEAPGVALAVVPAGDGCWEDLEAGRVDLVLAPFAPERGGLCQKHLFDERFVCLLREGHPAAKRKLTLDRFVELPHALIAPGGRPGGSVDDALALLGRTRRVTLMVPHFLVAPHIIARSDLVLTVPERIARHFAGLLPLRVLTPPIELPGFRMHQLWHERRSRDPRLTYLRKLIAEVAAGV
jgi:DNA-binding transcriptional LysR family regulator